MSLTLTYNTDILFNSIKVQQTDSGKYYKYVNDQKLYLTEGVTYQIKYKIYVESQLDSESSTVAEPFDIYMTSSQNSQPAFDASDILGYRIDKVSGSYNTFIEKSTLIIPTFEGTGSLCFAFKYGTYYISDIIVQPYSDVDFSVEEMRIRIPTPTQVKRYESISLYPIYIGGNNNPVGDVSLILSEGGQAGKSSVYQIVTGSNVVIDSDDNLVMGSLYVGSSLRTGVEISGYASALIRSIGYEGFYSASTYGNSGFMLYSGSVLSGSGDNYRGVGLEMHAGYNNGSLRYRVDDSGSFLEVSGNLYATNGYFSGIISASEGFIGGWSIDEHSIYSNAIDDSRVTLYSLQTFDSGPNSSNYSGIIISSSFGYHGFVQQTGSSDGAIIFVGSEQEYSSSNAPFYVNRDGFIHFESGEVGTWTVDMYSLTTQGQVGGTKIIMTSKNEDYLPELFGGFFISGSDTNFSGLLQRPNAYKGTPILFVNAPQPAGENNVKQAAFWVDYNGFTKTGNLVVCGSVYCSADIYAEDDIVAFSDRRLKKDIIEITSSLDIISNLHGVKFKKINDINNRERIGLIAQDVEEYLPQVVKTNDDGYKAINYSNIVALLIEGMKEHQKEIENLKNEINLLKNK